MQSTSTIPEKYSLLESHSNKVRLSKNQNFSEFRLSRNGESGFTLLELIIAIAIFSLVALATGAVLSNVTKANQTSEEALESLADIQRAMLIMERDFLQMVPRVPRIQGEENELMILGGDFEFDSDADGVGFVRNGWSNPQLMLPRSTLQNVSYRLYEGELQRLYTYHVDTIIGQEPKIRTLITGVTDFQVEAAFEFDNEELEWVEELKNTQLPIAIKLVITTEQYGEIERILQVTP